MRRAKRRDGNEKEIVDALNARGCSVQRLDGEGVPDLLVGIRGVNLLVEVKLPLGPKGGKSQRRECEGGRGDLTADQVRWFDGWKGDCVHVVRTVADVDALIAEALS